ncbi:polyphenol oxidase family protein [Arthrobacter oryzae]|uniref:polyphenol oxidase family protein n=1 Tax=Arthrobacter oryzae TaxID=409290 RepID=UPI00273C99CA|nr:polyphenol oxidase family protein [Arthrobacter oryzae]WLQ05543.1 polyphenol oxidase family protein [Arthrobacter oryzae]
MFWWRTEVRPGVWVAFTDAGAGNLALHVGDDPAEVHLRRGLLEAEAGLGAGRFQYMNQVHGNAVAYIGDTFIGDAAVATAGSTGAGGPTADAMVSSGRPLAVMVADCVPVVLAGQTAAGRPVLAVAHAGRPGVAGGVIPATVARMRAEGAEDIRAWIGPSICGSCYEVPEEMRADVAAAVPTTWCTTSWGTPGLDLPAGARSQLEDNGVAVEYSGPCTLETDGLFSYRGDPGTGRFAGLVWTGE